LSRLERQAALGKAADKLRGRTDALLKDFRAAIEQLVGEKGIDLSQGLTLELDPLGNLRVVGEHPQAGTIETTLARNPELASLFQRIEANLRLVEALESAQGKSEGAMEPLDLLGSNPESPARAMAEEVPFRLRIDGNCAAVVRASAH
jgi:hypothetical protein